MPSFITCPNDGCINPHNNVVGKPIRNGVDASNFISNFGVISVYNAGINNTNKIRLFERNSTQPIIGPVSGAIDIAAAIYPTMVNWKLCGDVTLDNVEYSPTDCNIFVLRQNTGEGVGTYSLLPENIPMYGDPVIIPYIYDDGVNPTGIVTITSDGATTDEFFSRHVSESTSSVSILSFFPDRVIRIWNATDINDRGPIKFSDTIVIQSEVQFLASGVNGNIMSGTRCVHSTVVFDNHVSREDLAPIEGLNYPGDGTLEQCDTADCALITAGDCTLTYFTIGDASACNPNHTILLVAFVIITILVLLIIVWTIWALGTSSWTVSKYPYNSIHDL